MMLLLELYSVVDDVFTEEDAFERAKLHMSLGRIYRAWKTARHELGGDDVGKKDVQGMQQGD